MVKLQVKTYLNKTTGDTVYSYKVGLYNPATRCGMSVGDCIFGQFALEPRIEPRSYIKNNQPSTFLSVNSSVVWLNCDDPEVVLNNFGNVSLSMPESIAHVLKAQQWVGRFFMIYLEPFKGQRGDDRVRFKIVETDNRGNVLPNQPQAQRYDNSIPQNRTTTPQYYPGHEPVQQQQFNAPNLQQMGYVPQPQVQTPVHIQAPNNNMPIGQNRMTGQMMNQARQQFTPQQPNMNTMAQNQANFNAGQQFNPQMNNVSAQNNVAQNANMNGYQGNSQYQVPPQNVFPKLNVPQEPKMAYSGIHMQQPIATMPPLPHNDFPKAQIPLGNEQVQVSNQPQPTSQQPTTKQQYAKSGLSSDEVEVLESLLNDGQLNDWKESANKNQEFFNQAMLMMPNILKQKGISVNPIPESRYNLLWEVWNTL